jgi:hypothetical protein
MRSDDGGGANGRRRSDRGSWDKTTECQRGCARASASDGNYVFAGASTASYGSHAGTSVTGLEVMLAQRGNSALKIEINSFKLGACTRSSRGAP